MAEGCCGGGIPLEEKKNVCVETAVALLREAFLDDLGKLEPAANRWWTYGPTLEGQGFGILCCSGLPRARVKAGDVVALTDAELAAILDSSLSFHEDLARKEKQPIAFVSEPSTPRGMALACMALEAPDKLSARMEFIDNHKNGL